MEIEVIESEVEEVVQEEEHDEVEQEVEAEAEQSEEEGDVVVLIGDEPAPDEETEIQAAPKWVKELRKSQRELQKENRELKAQLTQAKPKEAEIAVGPEPDLEDDDIDFDKDKFKVKYAEWLARKEKAAAVERDRQRAEEEKQKAWQVKVDAYAGAKEKLKVKDYEDAEETVVGTLAEIQQQVIIAYAKDPALMVYAIGKNPKEMARLAAITDPIEFALEMRDLEKKMKVEKRKPATQPESTITGTAPKSGAVDNQLERLRAEAAKSGDYSKVTAYKKQLKDKQRA